MTPICCRGIRCCLLFDIGWAAHIVSARDPEDGWKLILLPHVWVIWLTFPRVFCHRGSFQSPLGICLTYIFLHNLPSFDMSGCVVEKRWHITIHVWGEKKKKNLLKSQHSIFDNRQSLYSVISHHHHFSHARTHTHTHTSRNTFIQYIIRKRERKNFLKRKYLENKLTGAESKDVEIFFLNPARCIFNTFRSLRKIFRIRYLCEYSFLAPDHDSTG